ncbi:hypothetical protein C8J57DRAFT_1496278 [Mycena rebaudengoi]|nr:hypothetical protein C8J57DRAFT_1496278 [Mycena rebaudengoi]
MHKQTYRYQETDIPHKKALLTPTNMPTDKQSDHSKWYQSKFQGSPAAQGMHIMSLYDLIFSNAK